jgi:hypothetical protein
MAGLALMLTCLKAFTAFWSLVTMAVAAAMIDRFNYYCAYALRLQGRR